MAGVGSGFFADRGLRSSSQGHRYRAKRVSEDGSMNKPAKSISQHEALIYAMVTLSAADRTTSSPTRDPKSMTATLNGC